jgi:hypothetical protein
VVLEQLQRVVEHGIVARGRSRPRRRQPEEHDVRVLGRTPCDAGDHLGHHVPEERIILEHERESRHARRARRDRRERRDPPKGGQVLERVGHLAQVHASHERAHHRIVEVLGVEVHERRL